MEHDEVQAGCFGHFFNRKARRQSAGLTRQSNKPAAQYQSSNSPADKEKTVRHFLHTLSCVVIDGT